MSKTIKIIDLLNKIANGEELPEKIKYDNTIWQYSKAKTDYYQNTGSTILYFFAELVVYNKNWLNDTVQIIEEQEEIDIQSIKDIKDIYIENASCGEDVKYLARKYNEILKWAKQLDKKIKEKK